MLAVCDKKPRVNIQMLHEVAYQPSNGATIDSAVTITNVLIAACFYMYEEGLQSVMMPATDVSIRWPVTDTEHLYNSPMNHYNYNCKYRAACSES